MATQVDLSAAMAGDRGDKLMYTVADFAVDGDGTEHIDNRHAQLSICSIKEDTHITDYTPEFRDDDASTLCVEHGNIICIILCLSRECLLHLRQK